MRRIEVVRTYLTLDDPTHLRPGRPMAPLGGVRTTLESPCPVDLYRRLYREVGEQWYWHDRLEWSDAKLSAHLANPDVAVWVVHAGLEVGGYFELQRHEDGSVEIVYFGLVPAFIGKGLGGWMLERAAAEAWTMGATRVWLHTCTLDSERALPNYKARGFREYKTERLEVEIEGREVVGERLLSE